MNTMELINCYIVNTHSYCLAIFCATISSPALARERLRYSERSQNFQKFVKKTAIFPEHLQIRNICRVFIKYCVFSLKFFEFSELCQFCCSAGVLPAWRVYTDTEGKQSPENMLKNTIFNEHPVCL